jgi:hypothetical protein
LKKGGFLMNLKTWFKGLGVFVLSSFITSLAAANLSPSTFNFSKQGVVKLGTLALVVGLKAVLLYLKQSPLPSPNARTDWTRISGAVAFVVVLPAAFVTSGCVSSWERSTYATLATGKALIDCAVAGYNHFDADIRHACAADPADPAFDPAKFYIPQTRNAQQAIEKARQAQIACVEAFEGYAVAKVGKDKTVPLAEKQAAVAGYLTQLPALLSAVRALLGSPPASASLNRSGIGPDKQLLKGSTAFGGDPAAVIATLKPDTASWDSQPSNFTPACLRSPDLPITRSPDPSEVSLGQ